MNLDIGLPAAAAFLAGLAAVLTAAALVLAMAPQRLIADHGLGPSPWTTRRAIGAISALAGLATAVLSIVMGRPDLAWRLGVCAAALSAVALVDAVHLLVPDIYTALLAAVALSWLPSVGLGHVLLGAATGGGLLALVRWLFKRVRGFEGLGFGDVKLMAAAGALAGPERTLWIIVAAAALGLAWILIRKQAAAPFAACAAAPALMLLAFDKLS